MSTYTQILYQIVFGSKNYTHFLNQANQDVLYNYIAGICMQKKCKPYKIGGYSNHIHMIVCLHPSQNLSGLIKDVKTASNYMMLKKTELFSLFPGWQVGYGSFTYNYSVKNRLIEYVAGQAEHHKKINFQQELIAFCDEFGIEYDSKYLIK